MSGSRLRPYLGPVVALLVVLALGAGTVYAAIPNGDGKYYACYVKNTGAVKLINYPKVKTCKAGEKLINWNAKGPQGPAGPAGPVGPVGPVGPAGPAGAAGITKISFEWKTGSFDIPAPDPNTPAIDPTGSGLVTCQTGHKVTGGGFSQPTGYEVIITDSRPEGLNGWRVYGKNTGPDEETVNIFAICMNTTPSIVIAKAPGFNTASSKRHK